MAISGIGAPATQSILGAIYGVGAAGSGGGQSSGGTPLTPALFNSLLTGSTLSATFGSGSSIDGSGLFSALASSYGVSAPAASEAQDNGLYNLLT